MRPKKAARAIRMMMVIDRHKKSKAYFYSFCCDAIFKRSSSIFAKRRFEMQF